MRGTAGGRGRAEAAHKAPRYSRAGGGEAWGRETDPSLALGMTGGALGMTGGALGMTGGALGMIGRPLGMTWGTAWMTEGAAAGHRRRWQEVAIWAAPLVVRRRVRSLWT